MFSHSFPDDFPIRVRTKTFDDSTGHNRGSTKRLMPLTLKKPWFMGSSAAALEAGASATTNHHNAIRSDSASTQRLSTKLNSSNAAEAGNDVNREEVKPMPYHDYNPITVRQVQTDQELTIHYWFYVYLYSSDVDKLLTPFIKMVDSFGSDRRLMVIMNRCRVQILLKELELYKSLPRRIVVIKGAQWTNIVKALVEMEERLPDLMRFATFPMLLDCDTTKYACTKFDRTACINRLTRPIY